MRCYPVPSSVLLAERHRQDNRSPATVLKGLWAGVSKALGIGGERHPQTSGRLGSQAFQAEVNASAKVPS